MNARSSAPLISVDEQIIQPRTTMTKPPRFTLRALFAAIAIGAATVHAQIDPDPRQLLHLGINAPLNGNGPKGAYAFYYWNMPDIPTTNEVLRLAIAPTYVDSELGFKSLLGPNTDFALGGAGGAFANSYTEVRGGTYYKDQSFDGYSAGLSASIYQLVNPGGQIPLTGILRETVTYNSWTTTSDTGNNFVLPDNQPILSTRVGFRWGGMEPVITPTLAMEVSAWYELDKRTDAGYYGYNNDRHLNNTPQRVFARTLLRFTTFHDQHYVALGLQGGAAFSSDRLSCFRLGGVLPYTKEFPIVIPGYYFQEISAQDYGQAYFMYNIPFGPDKSWSIGAGGAAAVVKYQEGMGQGGALNSGVGCDVGYRAPSHKWKVLSMFGYGIEAKRPNSDGHGGYTLALAFQYNFGQTKLASDQAYDELRQEYLGSEVHSPETR
jgi:hypothetical protein